MLAHAISRSLDGASTSKTWRQIVLLASLNNTGVFDRLVQMPPPGMPADRTAEPALKQHHDFNSTMLGHLLELEDPDPGPSAAIEVLCAVRRRQRWRLLRIVTRRAPLYWAFVAGLGLAWQEILQTSGELDFIASRGLVLLGLTGALVAAAGWAVLGPDHRSLYAAYRTAQGKLKTSGRAAWLRSTRATKRRCAGRLAGRRFVLFAESHLIGLISTDARWRILVGQLALFSSVEGRGWSGERAGIRASAEEIAAFDSPRYW